MIEENLIVIKNLIERYPELKVCETNIINAVDIIINAINTKHKLIVCGNGGSAADALHIVGELMKGFLKRRPLSGELIKNIEDKFPENAELYIENLQEAIPAISLVGENALMTAFSNDKNGDLIFAQQVLGLGNRGDVMIAISTSGNSQNVIYACEIAKVKRLKIIGLTGSRPSKLNKIADECISAPSSETYRIQEYHLPIYHAICMCIENYFFKE